MSASSVGKFSQSKHKARCQRKDRGGRRLGRRGGGGASCLSVPMHAFVPKGAEPKGDPTRSDPKRIARSDKVSFQTQTTARRSCLQGVRTGSELRAVLFLLTSIPLICKWGRKSCNKPKTGGVRDARDAACKLEGKLEGRVRSQGAQHSGTLAVHFLGGMH